MLMTFDELLDTITFSSPEDWHVITCWGSGSGPSYKNRVTFYETYEGEDNILHSDSHATGAVYKANIALTLAFGLEISKEFDEEWIRKFPNPQASVDIADVFYNNALVFRTVYVVVDGGRTFLPMPAYANGPSVPTRYRAFVRLLDCLSGKLSQFDNYFTRAGLQVTNDRWLKAQQCLSITIFWQSEPNEGFRAAPRCRRRGEPARGQRDTPRASYASGVGTLMIAFLCEVFALWPQSPRHIKPVITRWLSSTASAEPSVCESSARLRWATVRLIDSVKPFAMPSGETSNNNAS
jgi:hypothetical protein